MSYFVFFCCLLIYTASKVKHHSNIFSETFFINDFLLKNNRFAILSYPSLSLISQSDQTAI